jgi:hypothetical protein
MLVRSCNPSRPSPEPIQVHEDTSVAWYNSLGSATVAMTYHAGGTDATHTNLVGAAKLASLVAGSVQSQGLPLAKYLR